MAGEESSKHNKICSATESFGNITCTGAASVSNDMSSYAVGGISTFDNSRQLRISYAGFNPCRTNRSGANTYFYNICTF
ncbi:hypothetical protein CI610_03206 [invertebrate metagenome]|uniref:Uncharacterized protein n=1 Tax=invertebrate metagenome TaxID=1711999 RepID=A0A2H9T3S9_9ZZZZ